MRRYLIQIKKQKFLSQFKKEQELFKDYPNLKINGAELNLSMDSLNEVYSKYIAKVSTAEMAVSLETSALLKILCGKIRPESVADLGSGFSSYVLNQSESDVISVDDNDVWLEKTKNFLENNGIKESRLLNFDAFKTIEKKFDLIFMDLNFVEERMKHTGLLLKKLKPGGMIIFDDVHKDNYLSKLEKDLPAGKYYLLSNLTRDKFGRFSLLYIND